MEASNAEGSDEMDTVVTLGSDRAERLRLNGTRAGGGGPTRSAKTYEPGRVCEAEGCATVLSRYNRHDVCWYHEPFRAYFGPVRGRRRAEAAVHDLTHLTAS